MKGDVQRQRQNSRGFQQKRWYRELLAELRTNGAACRLCAGWFFHESVAPGGLRLAHLEPFSTSRRPASRESCTLACRECDTRMGEQDWTGIVPSLADMPVASTVEVDSGWEEVRRAKKAREREARRERARVAWASGVAGVRGGAT